MTDVRKRILIIIISVVVVALILALAYYFFGKKEEPTPTGEAPQGQTAPQEIQQPDFTPPTERTVQSRNIEPEDNYIRQLARIFVERFRTFSNQNENSHIKNVLPMVTSKMAIWVKSQAVEQAFIYEGITTKVIVNEIESLTSSNAAVHIEVQEFIEKEGSEETNYRTGTVYLERYGNEWKISGLFWNE